jgi:hypothetical protein
MWIMDRRQAASAAPVALACRRLMQHDDRGLRFGAGLYCRVVVEGGLFAGAAGFYARYRPGYPAELVAEVVRRFALTGAGRLLDLGCGTGQLTIPLTDQASTALLIHPEQLAPPRGPHH